MAGEALLGQNFTPRDYQVKAYEAALRKNQIIVMPTGAGKTFVAIMLMRYYLLSLPPPPDTHKKLVVFLAKTQDLVTQQADSIDRHLCDIAKSALRFIGIIDFIKDSGRLSAEVSQADVLASTYGNFRNLLEHGYWSLSRVSLLVMDECHEVHGNSPGSAIMRDFYIPAAQSRMEVPRVLGLTATPFSTKDVKGNSQELSRILQADIFEVEIEYVPPVQTSVSYDPPTWNGLSGFGDTLQTAAPSLVEKNLVDVQLVYKDLGFFAGDMYLEDLAAEDPHFSDAHPSGLKALLSQNEEMRRNLWSRPDDFLPHEVRFYISHKVSRLIKCINQVREEKQMARCLVFVERRAHAQALARLVSALPLKQPIKAKPVTGGSGKSALTPDQQAQTGNRAVLESFREGGADLLVATDVLGQGIDIPNCNLVVAFDVVKVISNPMSYIQARGRARSKDSVFAVMLENNNDAEKRAYDAVKEQAETPSRFPPKDSTPDSATEDLEALPESIAGYHWYEIASTGAKITAANAVSLLAELFAGFQFDDYSLTGLLYVAERTDEGFRCTLTVPRVASLASFQGPERTRVGPWQPTKRLAKALVAFEMCCALHKAGVLDDHLVSCRKAEERNPVDANGRAVDRSRADPLVPASVRPFLLPPDPTYQAVWWLYIVDLHFEGVHIRAGLVSSGYLGDPSLLTAGRSPQQSLAIDFGQRIPLSQLIQPFESLSPSAATLDDAVDALQKFNRTAIKLCLNRKFDEHAAALPCLLAPLCSTSTEIDWAMVSSPLQKIDDVSEIGPNDLVVTPFAQLTARLFHLDGVRPGLSSGSPLQWHEPVPMRRKWFRQIANHFKNYNHFSKVVLKAPIEYEYGPLVGLRRCQIPGVTDEPTTDPPLHILPLELVYKTRITVEMLSSFSLIPRIYRLIEDSQTAKDLTSHLGLPSIPIPYLIEALTHSACKMGYSYETLETVGDAFAQLATSIHLYSSYPHFDEGLLSQRRSVSVDNLFFKKRGIAHQLQKFIMVDRIHTRTWMPLMVSERSVPSKSLADAVEALLGAALISGDCTSALQVGDALGLCFGGPVPWPCRERPTHYVGPCILSPAEAGLEEGLGYTFRSKHLLVEALTHPSCPSIDTMTYERKEFLGDGATPGELSLMRQCLVSNPALSFIAVTRLNVSPCIRHGSPALQGDLARAVKEGKAWANPSQPFSNMTWLWDPPKVLGDVLEALIGAIFEDSGFDLPATYQVLRKIYRGLVDKIQNDGNANPYGKLAAWRMRHAPTALHITTSRITETKVWRVTISLHSEQIAAAQHATKSVARHRAALRALGHLGLRDCGQDSEPNLPLVSQVTPDRIVEDAMMSENERMEIEQDEIEAHEESIHGPPAAPWDTEADSEDEFIEFGGSDDEEAEEDGDVDLEVSLGEGDDLPSILAKGIPAHNGKHHVAGPTLDSFQMPEDDPMYLA